jgi:fumarate hydratase class II
MMKGNDGSFRIERDSMGEIKVPKGAYFGVQTQRAIENFCISSLRFPRVFVRALGFIKRASARANGELGLLEANLSRAIREASEEVTEESWNGLFPEEKLDFLLDPMKMAHGGTFK